MCKLIALYTANAYIAPNAKCQRVLVSECLHSLYSWFTLHKLKRKLRTFVISSVIDNVDCWATEMAFDL